MNYGVFGGENSIEACFRVDKATTRSRHSKNEASISPLDRYACSSQQHRLPIMSTVITRKVARDSGSDSETYREKSTVTSNVIEIPELGAPRKERQFLWESQDKSYDPDHIGTQVRHSKFNVTKDFSLTPSSRVYLTTLPQRPTTSPQALGKFQSLPLMIATSHILILIMRGRIYTVSTHWLDGHGVKKIKSSGKWTCVYSSGPV